jgi:hypothetical protein
MKYVPKHPEYPVTSCYCSFHDFLPGLSKSYLLNWTDRSFITSVPIPVTTSPPNYRRLSQDDSIMDDEIGGARMGELKCDNEIVD